MRLMDVSLESISQLVNGLPRYSDVVVLVIRSFADHGLYGTVGG